MNKNLQTRHSIEIEATKEKLWDVLTNPTYIAEYLYGTHTETDWNIGSEITFRGNYQGNKYEDKGIVMAHVPNQLLAYDYWSQFSGLEDIPENYCEVSYHIDEHKDGHILFTWQQIGFKDESAKAHNEAGIPAILTKIKELAEAE